MVEAPNASVPAAPLHVLAVSVGGDEVELSWEAPAGRPGEMFRIYWDKGLGYRMYAPKTTVRGTKYIGGGLRPSTTYRYLVTTYDGQAESSPASVVVKTSSWLSLPLAQVASPSPAGDLAVATEMPGGTPSATQPSPPPQEVILGLMGTNDYVDDLGVLHLVGEVHNDGSRNVDQIRIAITFYDEAGNVVDDITASALLELLAPGQRSPFVVVWENPLEWKRYSVRVTARPTTERSLGGFTLLQSYARLDDEGLYHVVGTIRNDGLATGDYLRVVVTLYDAFGKISNAGFAYVRPSQVAPGATGTFDCLFEYYPYRAEHVVQIAER
jgi:hypothetical protein